MEEINFSSRGPTNIIVLDRNGVKITDVCNKVCERVPINSVCNRYNITVEEIFACINTFVDVTECSPKDFLEMYAETIDGEIAIDTTDITDWAFLSVINFSAQFYGHKLNSFNDYYSKGIEVILIDCLLDIKSNDCHWVDVSEIHNLVLKAFEEVNGLTTIDNVDLTLEQLGYNNPHTDTGNTIH